MDLKLEPFKMTVIVKAKYYPMYVEQTFLSDEDEHFKLSGGNKEAVIACNRPQLRRQNDMRREFEWRDISEKFDPEVFKHITGILEIEIYAREHPEVSWTRTMLGND